MQMVLRIILLVFLVKTTLSTDFPTEKEYDSEFDDELDAIKDLNEADSAFQRAFSSFDDDNQDFLETDGNNLESDDLENDDEEYDPRLIEQMEEEMQREAEIMRIVNLINEMAKKYAIKLPHKKPGVCSAFKAPSHSVHKCYNQKTFLGEVKVCKVTCKSGYHLKNVIPHYELCGAPTKWRWTYQLRGYSKAEEMCLKGSQIKKIPTSCTDSHCISTAAYYMNKINFNINPCDDFFEYSCGRWLDETPYPPGGRLMTYTILRQRVKKDMAKLLGAPMLKTDIASVKKAKIVYKSCMGTALIDALDKKPLLNLLKKEIAWPVIDNSWTDSNFDFESTLATLRGKYNNNIMFTVRVAKSFTGHILQTWKGSTTLPYQYYVNDMLEEKRDAYVAYMKDIAIMLGADQETAENDMQNVFQFEKQIALLKAMDIDFLSQKTLEQMNYDIPGVDWLKLFKKMITSYPVTSSTLVEVWNSNYLHDMIKLMGETDKRTIQNYMVWRFVKHRIPYLSRRFQLRDLEFRSAIYGITALHQRWYSCSLRLMYAMKGPTGKMFVDGYFSEAKKKTAEEMFHNIRNAFIYLLGKEVNWMDKKTKEYAKEKALYMKAHIGYNPAIYENATYLNNQWKKFVAKKNDYFGNVLRILHEVSQNTFYKLNNRYDPMENFEFTTRPTMVNAFYSPSYNSINLPAGEMQYPFYWGDKFPKVFQYGAIGTILGHETTHGFDNNGALRDKYGNLRNWWSASSWKEFHKRTSCMANQYSNYFWKAAGTYLDGHKTLGENIADNGGIRESYQGYKFYLKNHNLTGEEIEPSTGLTNDQMFFVGFANVRCAKYTHRAAYASVFTSVHSPGRFRVIGSLQNFDKFSKAFNCPLNSYMNPAKKCVIW